MGVRLASAQTHSLITGSWSNSEVLIATVGPVNIPADSGQVFLSWFLQTSTGTGITIANVRLRRGTLVTSQQVGLLWQHTVTASGNFTLSGNYEDQPPAGAELIYGLTLQGTGATSTCSVTDFAFTAMCL